MATKSSPFLPLRVRAILDKLTRHHAHNVLKPGESLSVGSYLESLQGTKAGDRWVPAAMLVMQPDGDLVLYVGGKPSWSSGTASKAGSYVVMDPLGALVIYDCNHTPVWTSETSAPGSIAVVDAGTLTVQESPSTKVLWTSRGKRTPSPAHDILAVGFDPDLNPGDPEDPWDPVAGALLAGIQPSYSNPVTGEIRQEHKADRSMRTQVGFGGDSLGVNSTLAPNQSLTSANGTYHCTFQSDGNLVVYDQGGNVKWASGTNGKGPTRCIMQSDGNLVLYVGSDDSKPVWDSGSRGSNTRAVMQNDGNFVIYDGSNHPLWASNDHQGGGFLGIHVDIIQAVKSLLPANTQAAFNQAANALSNGVNVSAVLKAAASLPPAQSAGASAAAALATAHFAGHMASFGPDFSAMQKGGSMLMAGFTGFPGLGQLTAADLKNIQAGAVKTVMTSVAASPPATAGAMHAVTVIQAKQSLWAKIKAFFSKKSAAPQH